MIRGVLRLHNPMSALVWLALLVPGHLFDGRLGYCLPAIVLLLSGAALFAQPAPWETLRPARQAAAFFFLLALLDAVSYAYALAFNGVRTGPADLWALGRPLYAGLFTVYLIRHHDPSVRKALESALTVLIYFTLFLRSIGAPRAPLFEPAPVGYLAVLAAVYFLFFARAPLWRLHAACAALVVVFSPPLGLVSAREAALYFWRSPVFGWGPALYEPMSSVGNQYLRWLLRNGVVGTGAILIGLGLAAFRLLRASWTDRGRRAGAAIFVGFAALMLLTGPFLEDFRLFVLTVFLIAGMHEGARA